MANVISLRLCSVDISIAAAAMLLLVFYAVLIVRGGIGQMVAGALHRAAAAE